MKLPIVNRVDGFTVHNLIGHPLSEVAHLLGLDEWARIFHDSTLPDHQPGTGRG